MVGKKVGAEVFEKGTQSPVKTAKQAIEYARSMGYDTVILDTAGRLQIDETLMCELENIKKEVEEYLNTLHCKIEEHLLTPADYYPTKEGGYSVRLRIIESGISIVDLNINVPNLAAAQSVCESWPYKYQNVYDKIMEELL